MTSQPSPGQAIMEMSPKFAELTKDVLFGDLWERPQLSQRERSLIVVAALTALYRKEELRGHVGRALDNGLSKDEIHEVFLQMAFYAGWPTAVNGFAQAKEVYEQRGI